MRRKDSYLARNYAKKIAGADSGFSPDRKKSGGCGEYLPGYEPEMAAAYETELRDARE